MENDIKAWHTNLLWDVTDTARILICVGHPATLHKRESSTPLVSQPPQRMEEAHNIHALTWEYVVLWVVDS